MLTLKDLALLSRIAFCLCALAPPAARAIGVCNDITHQKNPPSEKVRKSVTEEILPELYSAIEAASTRFGHPLKFGEERFSFHLYLSLKDAKTVLASMNDLISTAAPKDGKSVDFSDTETNAMVFDEALAVVRSRVSQLGLDRKITFHPVHGSLFGFDVRFYSDLKSLGSLLEELITTPIVGDYDLRFTIQSVYFDPIRFNIDRNAGYESGWQGEQKQFCKIYELHLQGKTFGEIADALNRTPEELFSAGRWSEQNVRGLLQPRLDFYAEMAQKGYSMKPSCD